MSTSASNAPVAGDKRVKKFKKSRKPRYKKQHGGRVKTVASNHPVPLYNSDDSPDEHEDDLESESVPEGSGANGVREHTSRHDTTPDREAGDQQLPRKRPRITLKLSKPHPSPSLPEERPSEDVGEQTVHDHQAPVAAVSQDAPLPSKEQSLRALTPVYDHYLGYREIDAASLVNTKKFILSRTCPQWMLSYPSSPAVQPWQSAQLDRALARPSISPVLPGIASFPDPFSCSGTPSSVGCRSADQPSANGHLRSHALLDRPAAVARAPYLHKPATRPELPKPSGSHFLIHKAQQSHDLSRSLVPSRRPAQSLSASQKPNKARHIRSTPLDDETEPSNTSFEHGQAEASNTSAQTVPCRPSELQPSVDTTQPARPQNTLENVGNLAAPVQRSARSRDGTGPVPCSGTGQELGQRIAEDMHIPEGWTRNAVMAAESYREKHGKYPIEFARALKRPKMRKATNRNVEVSGRDTALGQAQPGSSENPIDLC